LYSQAMETFRYVFDRDIESKTWAYHRGHKVRHRATSNERDDQYQGTQSMKYNQYDTGITNK
jgi:hypothetical protein